MVSEFLSYIVFWVHALCVCSVCMITSCVKLLIKTDLSALSVTSAYPLKALQPRQPL